MTHRHIHISSGIILAIIFAVAAVLFFSFQGNKYAQMIIAVICGAVYSLWGIFHHSLKKDLYLKVVIEYLLVSAIGVILMLMVLS